MKWIITVLFMAISLASVQTMAAERNDIPSCYAYAQLTEYRSPVEGRELFVVIDQTVHLDNNMKNIVHQQVQNFANAGDRITLVTFSAMAKGEYTNIPYTGLFENELPKDLRNSINRIKLRKLENCLKKQKGAIKVVHKKLNLSFNDGDESYPKTELVGTVLSIGNDLISRSMAKRKIVLLVSDMLENSETLTFYHKGSVKVPSAEKSYNKIKEQGFTSDFAKAEMHVIGAGYIHGGKNYSSQQSMLQLEKFWRMILKDANLELKQFGKPNLLTSVN